MKICVTAFTAVAMVVGASMSGMADTRQNDYVVTKDDYSLYSFYGKDLCRTQASSLKWQKFINLLTFSSDKFSPKFAAYCQAEDSADNIFAKAYRACDNGRLIAKDEDETRLCFRQAEIQRTNTVKRAFSGNFPDGLRVGLESGRGQNLPDTLSVVLDGGYLADHDNARVDFCRLTKTLSYEKTLSKTITAFCDASDDIYQDRIRSLAQCRRTEPSMNMIKAERDEKLAAAAKTAVENDWNPRQLRQAVADVYREISVREHAVTESMFRCNDAVTANSRRAQTGVFQKYFPKGLTLRIGE